MKKFLINDKDMNNFSFLMNKTKKNRTKNE